eukprot:m.40678 g.40678  ORF g.40678 m.40678 type:complete len:1150 (+) comp33000_c0_seq2:222-3671(+)
MLFYSRLIFVLLCTIIAVHAGPRGEPKKEPKPPVPKEKEKAASDSSWYVGRNPSCAAEVQANCPRADPRNNFQVLLCLQKDASILSPECHLTLWQFKQNMTLDIRLDGTLESACSKQIASLCKGVKTGKGELLGCLLDHKSEISAPRCHSVVLRMQAIVFSDYRLIREFATACTDDITRLQCARVESLSMQSIQQDQDTAIKTQGATISCLEDKINEVSPPCKERIMKKEEAAADNIHLDAALYEACKEVLDKFCSEVGAQPGKVYDCLYQHKFDRAVSSECKHHIRRRQKLEAADYKVDYTFTKACQKDIKSHGCNARNKEDNNFGKMARILICLNDAYNVKGAKLSHDCLVRGTEISERLMGDYDLNHQLVDACQDIVGKYCSDQLAGQQEGRVIDCLMDLRTETEDEEEEEDDEDEDEEEGQSKNMGKLNPKCAEELDKLVERVDPARDFHIDHALQSACMLTITSKCSTKGEEDSKVFSCLMEHIDDDDMPEECSKHLFHLQYFISRNFRLDHELFAACRDDAKQVCSSQFNFEDGQQKAGAQLPPQMILACLYRQEVGHGGDKEGNSEILKISKACHKEVFRTLRERATSVKLNPTIEKACMVDLAKLCPNIEEDMNGAEFDCLQKNLDILRDDCRKKVSQWTKLESQDARLDHSMMKACRNLLNMHCKDFVGKGEGRLMGCLKKHKNDAQVRPECKKKLEAYQEVEAKDKSFDFELSKVCQKEGASLCPETQTKDDALKCFIKVFEDEKKRSTVSSGCRDLLKLAMLEMNENIKLDPSLASACESEAQRFCEGIEPGEGKIIECLRRLASRDKKRLTAKCLKELSEKEEMEAKHPDLDYRLQRICQTAIATVCKGVPLADALQCLEKNKHTLADPACQRVITERQIEAGEDFQLDPHLMKACQLDIPKFCRDVPIKGSKMIQCLKKAYDKPEPLSDGCKKAVHFREQQAMENPRLDAALYSACKDEEVLQHCSEDSNAEGFFLSCLKKQFSAPKGLKQFRVIKTTECMQEISRIMKEGVADVHNDPLLFKQCAFDLHKFCRDIPFGSGQKIVCLLGVYSSADQKRKLSRECAVEVKGRVEMWDNAVEIGAPESIKELIDLVARSQSRFSVLGMFTIFVTAFVFLGCFFGRKCRRRRKQRGKKQ